MTPDLNARPSRGEAPGLSTARFAGVVTSQKMMAIDPQSDLSPVLRNHRERGSSPLLSLSGLLKRPDLIRGLTLVAVITYRLSYLSVPLHPDLICDPMTG